MTPEKNEKSDFDLKERYVKSIKAFIDDVLNNRRVEYKIEVVERVLELYTDEIKYITMTIDERDAMIDLVERLLKRLIYSKMVDPREGSLFKNEEKYKNEKRMIVELIDEVKEKLIYDRQVYSKGLESKNEEGDKT